MSDPTAQDLRRHIRDIPDFPKPGIVFKDITPLLADRTAFHALVDRFTARYRGRADMVLGIESRGFIVGALAARELGAGFVPVRKAGKLPWEVLRESYSLEYDKDTIEMHVDGVRRGNTVLVVDDVIATGGTAKAACALAERAGGNVCGLSFLVELTALRGREHLGRRPVHAVLQY